MAKIRVPMQKRSLEKHDRIIKAGFDLFCEKGYYKTNTAEIAKCAGVSIGAVYSYFSDKRQIFIEAFHQYLDAISTDLLDQLSSSIVFTDSHNFIDNWIKVYINLYAESNHALTQLRLVIADDDEVNHYFSKLENEYFMSIVKILKSFGITCEDIFEKVYISCILIDSLRQENTAFSHEGLNYEILKEQTIKSISNILSI